MTCKLIFHRGPSKQKRLCLYLKKSGKKKGKERRDKGKLGIHGISWSIYFFQNLLSKFFYLQSSRENIDERTSESENQEKEWDSGNEIKSDEKELKTVN